MSDTAKKPNKPNAGELIIGDSHNSSFTDQKVDGRTITQKQIGEILHDGYIRSLWEKRRSGVVAVDWAVTATQDKNATVPPQNQQAADFIAQWLTTIDFDKITRQMLSAIWYGYSTAQMIWDVVDGYWVPIDIKVHDHTKFSYDKNQWKVTNANGVAEALDEYKFWIFTAQNDHDDVPYGRGLGLDLHMPWYLRKHGWRFWGEYLEKFGSPAVKGVLPEGTDFDSTNAEKLSTALESVHNLGWLVIPHGYEVDFLTDGAKGAKSNHELFVEKWEQLIPIIILGQTMTTQDGASQSQATVHKDVQDEIVQADADLLCQSFNTTVIRWITQLNFANATPPSVWRRIAQADDLNARATRDVQLTSGSGYRMTQQYITDTYGIELEKSPNPQPHNPQPHDPQGVVSFAENPPVTTEVLDKDDTIENLVDRAIQKHGGDNNLFAAFAEQLIEQYDTVQAMFDDWANIERTAMNDPALTAFAADLQNTLNTAFVNGAISTDAEVT